MTLQVIKDQSIINKINIVESIKRWTLNYTDIVSNNNKYYNCELVKDSNNKFWLYTSYGRVGANGVKEYRMCNDQYHAESEAEKIIKSKIKKGYQKIDIIKAAVGSEVGKSKVEANSASIESLKKMGVKIKEDDESSKLHPQVQSLVRSWFGATQEFINLNLDTGKCPLGQLSLSQIDKAKDILSEARKIIHSKKPDQKELNNLTSSYYSNIPHVLPHRINADLLRFDDDLKLDKALDILDVFADAKNVQAVLSKKSAVDSQYATLKADLEFLEPSDPTYKWLDTMFHETRAYNHGALGKMKVHRIFKVNRNNEKDIWLKNAEKIAKENCGFNPSKTYSKLVEKRPDVPKDLEPLYKSANILPGWHGTRRANMAGITTRGLLIAPSGVVTAGAMYGSGCYWATNSSKSVNYCDVKGSYWAQGSNKTAFLILADIAFGKQKSANGSSYYTANNIKPYHSVFAKAGGNSGVINDELITYYPSGPNQQHHIKYILEFETQVK